MENDSRYLMGRKSIAQFFGLNTWDINKLLEGGGIPGAFKTKRSAVGGFRGGGTGTWALNRELAEQYRHTRHKTPPYDPRMAVEALLNNFPHSGAQNIPDLISMGLITDLNWCDELDRQRELSNMHIPILMHPVNLADWLDIQVDTLGRRPVYSNTKEIFKAIRNRG